MDETKSVLVPIETLQKWLKLLDSSRFISDGEDEDNNYDVITVYDEIKRLLSGQNPGT